MIVLYHFDLQPSNLILCIQKVWLQISDFITISSWTDQQRAAAAKEGWGYRLVFSARLVFSPLWAFTRIFYFLILTFTSLTFVV